MQLIYPWDEKAKAMRRAKPQIWEDLYKNNPGCLKYVEQKANEKVIYMIEKAFQKINTGKWCIIACNSIRELQTFNEVMPLVYSLTTQKFSWLTDTGKVIDIIQGRAPIDPALSIKESFSYLEKLTLYPFLLWDSIFIGDSWCTKYTGRVTTLLQERVRDNKIFVTTYLYSGEFEQGSIDEMFNYVETLWGKTLKSILSDMSELLIFKIKEKKESTCKVEEI